MTFAVSANGLDQLIVRMDTVSGRIDSAVLATMQEQVKALRVTAAERMAALFKDPGRMQESLSDEVVPVGTDTVHGTVTASGLPYLRIQEFGGVTRPHDIFPVNAAVLSWLSPGGVQFKGNQSNDRVFAMVVHHPGSRIPERSYMRSALAMRRAAIVEAFRGATIAQVAELETV